MPTGCDIIIWQKKDEHRRHKLNHLMVFKTIIFKNLKLYYINIRYNFHQQGEEYAYNVWYSKYCGIKTYRSIHLCCLLPCNFYKCLRIFFHLVYPPLAAIVHLNTDYSYCSHRDLWFDPPHMFLKNNSGKTMNISQKLVLRLEQKCH